MTGRPRNDGSHGDEPAFEECRRRLAELDLCSLDERRRRILCGWYGLGLPRQSLKQLASQEGLSVTSISQLRRSALCRALGIPEPVRVRTAARTDIERRSRNRWRENVGRQEAARRQAEYADARRHPCALCGCSVSYNHHCCPTCARNLTASRHRAARLSAEVKRAMAKRAAAELIATGRVSVRLLNGYWPKRAANEEQ